MICVSLYEPSVALFLEKLKFIEFAEIRLDALDIDEIKNINLIFKTHTNLIATCRKNSCYNDIKRKAVLINAIDLGAAYVDIEIDSDESFKEDLIRYAFKKNVKVIISYHNYEKTPSLPELKNIIEMGIKDKADIIKVAVKVNNLIDNNIIMALPALYEKTTIITIGMGELGKITRISAPFTNTPFTFVSFDENSATAPGQLSIKEFEHIKGLING